MNPYFNGSSWSIKYVPQPVKKAEPVIIGITASKSPALAVSLITPLKIEPMNDSYLNSSPTLISPQ